MSKCAERMRAHLRQTDILCRYGGDEFGIILPETAKQDALGMMCRLAEDFKELGRAEGAPEGFGMSFGVSAHQVDRGTVRHLVKAADDRLILSKKSKGPVLASATKAPLNESDIDTPSGSGFPEQRERYG